MTKRQIKKQIKLYCKKTMQKDKKLKMPALQKLDVITDNYYFAYTDQSNVFVIDVQDKQINNNCILVINEIYINNKIINVPIKYKFLKDKLKQIIVYY